MPSISKAAVSAFALVAMVQYCPAPFLALIPEAVAVGMGAVGSAVGAAGTVAGSVTAGIEGSKGKRTEFNSRIKRQDYGLGTAWQDCHDELVGASVTFSAPSIGTVLVKGIPPACMTLSTVITGQFDAGDPVPEGTDSIQFSNLTDDEIQQIQDALNAHS